MTRSIFFFCCHIASTIILVLFLQCNYMRAFFIGTIGYISFIDSFSEFYLREMQTKQQIHNFLVFFLFILVYCLSITKINKVPSLHCLLGLWWYQICMGGGVLNWTFLFLFDLRHFFSYKILSNFLAIYLVPPRGLESAIV